MNAKYGFYTPLSSDFPSQVIVDLTEICNLKCRHCPYPIISKESWWGFRQLDPVLHIKLIDEIVEKGPGKCLYVRYTANGEPLLHLQVVEMLGYAAEQLRKVSIPVNLTTNGISLTKDKAKGLVNAGVSVIDVSIDAACASTYKLIRGGSFKKVMQNTKNLIKVAKGSRTKIVVSFVKQDGNEEEVDEFEMYWFNEGADRVVIRELHTAAGFIPGNMKSDRFPCVYPWERLSLGADGYIHFCPQDWTHGSRVANFRGQTIESIWASDFMSNLRIAHLNNDFRDYSLCRKCPDWAITHWPHESNAYRDLMEDLKGEEDWNNAK